MKFELKPMMWGLMWRLTTKRHGYNINLSFHFSYEKAKERYDQVNKF